MQEGRHTAGDATTAAAVVQGTGSGSATPPRHAPVGAVDSTSTGHHTPDSPSGPEIPCPDSGQGLETITQ